MCSIQQKTAVNARLTDASPLIPSKVSLLVQRQHANVLEDVATNAEAIAADARAIRDECRASLAAYNSAVCDVYDHDYIKAIDALETILKNSEAIVTDVHDISTRASNIRTIIKGSIPFTLAAAGMLLRLFH